MVCAATIARVVCSPWRCQFSSQLRARTPADRALIISAPAPHRNLNCCRDWHSLQYPGPGGWLGYSFRPHPSSLMGPSFHDPAQVLRYHIILMTGLAGSHIVAEVDVRMRPSDRRIATPRRCVRDWKTRPFENRETKERDSSQRSRTARPSDAPRISFPEELATAEAEHGDNRAPSEQSAAAGNHPGRTARG